MSDNVFGVNVGQFGTDSSSLGTIYYLRGKWDPTTDVYPENYSTNSLWVVDLPSSVNSYIFEDITWREGDFLVYDNFYKIYSIVQKATPLYYKIIGDGTADTEYDNSDTITLNFSLIDRDIVEDYYDTVKVNSKGIVTGVASGNINIKQFGAIGDGTLHTLQEWIDSGKYNSLATIQGDYPKADSLTNSIDWLAIQTACDTASVIGKAVYVPAGVYLFNKTLYHHIYLYSDSPLPSWRSAPFSSTVPDEYSYQFGSTFLFIGNGPKTQTIKFVSESRQCGYDRPNPNRLYNNQYDAEFLMTDFTNKDASGTTPATSKLFSAAVVVGTGTTKRPVMGMENIRIITSCPGDSETYGWKGYADQSTFRDWAHWDVGVWYKSPCSPRRARLHKCQIVGYWDIRGHLMTTFSDYDLQNAGYAEFYDVDRCVIQCGTSFRSGDIWPIIDKTVDTLSVEWTASHQFPSSGTLS